MKSTKLKMAAAGVILLAAILMSTTGSFSESSYVDPEYCETESSQGIIVNGPNAGQTMTCYTTSCYSLLTDLMTFQETCCDGMGCSRNY